MNGQELAELLSQRAHELAMEQASQFIGDTKKDEAARAKRGRNDPQQGEPVNTQQ